MSGQIIDATLVVGPRQRNTTIEKAEIKAGLIQAEWQARPASAIKALSALLDQVGVDLGNVVDGLAPEH